MVILLRTGLLATVLAGTAVHGEVIFLEPTPYLSAADSPFNLFAPMSYVEDFEDGSFDLPAGVTTYPYLLKAPSSTTDSVDADDVE